MAIKIANRGVVKALLVSNLVSLALFGLRVLAVHNDRYGFLFWNLMLAWLPLLLAWLLMKRLKQHSWQEPLPVLFTLLWLGFLPNSFYLMSDLIHLQATGEIGLLFDVVLFLSCIFNGLVAGFISMYMVHKAIIRRRGSYLAGWLMTAVILLVSFAIYLGRILRWNSWDVFINPAGVLFDVSERVINPLAHPQVLVTTATFFLLIGSMYYVLWEILQFGQKQPKL